MQTTDGIASAAVRKAHSEHLDRARESLERDPIEIRDFTSTTMAINVNKIPEAKQLIREFRSRLTKLLEADPKSEVYVFSAQLFPLSRRSEGGT
jgi:uncharacterized protein (TIGR02147 family)